MTAERYTVSDYLLDRLAELGVDRIFGRGTTPGEVASYLVSALVPAPSTRKKAS